VTDVAAVAGNRRSPHGDSPDMTALRRPVRRRPVLRRAVLATLVLVSFVGAACGGDEGAGDSESADYSGYTRDPAPSVLGVSLPDAGGGDEVEMSAAPGGLRIVYFGYTSCPDVCPTTMADLKRALASLPEERSSRVSFVMVTVDPDRDVAEKLDAYVTTFIPEGESARTEDDAELRAAADAFGADYEVTTDEDGEIQVSHTGELYAVDGNGDVVLQWPFGTTAESLAADIDRLLDDVSFA
jgi:protein SCO1